MNHFELCKRLAEHELKKKTSKVVLYEYKSTASVKEEPDVIVFEFDKSVLYEIKVSHSDFLADAKKACRKKYKSSLWINWETTGDKNRQREILRIQNRFPELFLKQSPHLGNYRFYVCTKGLIKTEELPFGWGLVEFDEKTGRFYTKAYSEKFRTNMKIERNLLLHSMQRKYNGNDTGIFVREY